MVRRLQNAELDTTTDVFVKSSPKILALLLFLYIVQICRLPHVFSVTDPTKLRLLSPPI